ncbi:MAG: EAL domain-containing protein [Arcobacteraceae bacterium]
MNFNLTFHKKFLFFCLLFLGFLSAFFAYKYYNEKKELNEKFFSDINKQIEFVVSDLQEKILKSNNETIYNILQVALNTISLESIKIQYKNLIFSKENLIKNSTQSQNTDWEISEVTTDVKNGYVILQSNNMYRFFNTITVNIEEPINFRFLLHKNQRVINTLSSLSFYYVLKKEVLSSTAEYEKTVNSRMLYVLDQPLANFEYIIDEQKLYQEINKLKQAYLWNTLYIGIIGIIFALLIYLFFIKKMLLEPMLAFKSFMKDALENNLMHKLDEKTGHNPDIDEAFRLLNKILRKYIGVVNELNINKGILERKVFTDDLTGLPNQKVFELDLKNMFIVGSDGFIGSIKLEALGNFTKEYGSALANHLIEEFTHVVQNKFYEVNLQEATLYRFFGSEFAMILKNEEENKVLEFAQSLNEELKELQARYEVKGILTYFSFVPFDKYGTIDSILHASSDAYTIAKTKDETYYIVSPSEVLDKFQFLEQNVREIIENSFFEVTFGLETRTTDESNRLLMQEAIPILYDKNKEKFSIGVFVSVAEKINLAVQFDKIIIEEVIKYIKNNEIDYNIAINLSMASLEDSEFINWLHSLFLYNKNISKYLVFSMTSYNASTNIEVFKTFIDEIHRFGSKIILKRFSSNDFTVDQLEEFHLDYLRINKEYTNAIAKDRDKKHFLRTIVNFGQSNDIIIIGDSIKDEKDIEICTAIGLDAISNY